MCAQTRTQHRLERGDTVTRAHPVDPARCFHAALKQKISCELVHSVILMQQTCSTLSLSHKHTQVLEPGDLTADASVRTACCTVMFRLH